MKKDILLNILKSLNIVNDLKKDKRKNVKVNPDTGLSKILQWKNSEKDTDE